MRLMKNQLSAQQRQRSATGPGTTVFASGREEMMVIVRAGHNSVVIGVMVMVLDRRMRVPALKAQVEIGTRIAMDVGMGRPLSAKPCRKT